MADTVIELKKHTEIGNRQFLGGVQVVTRATADELVVTGNAKILSTRETDTAEAASDTDDAPKTAKKKAA